MTLTFRSAISGWLIEGRRRLIPVRRRTVDLQAYPDLVVIYLGMRVNVVTGLRTLLGIGPHIARSAKDVPDGLLSHEIFFMSLFPPHVGIRQYWRDFASLETWSRSEPHRTSWKNFLRSSGGTGFWHETYRMRGGIEAIYDDVPTRIGLARFAPFIEARGGMFSARRRLARHAEDLATGTEPEAVVPEPSGATR